MRNCIITKLNTKQKREEKTKSFTLRSPLKNKKTLKESARKNDKSSAVTAANL